MLRDAALLQLSLLQRALPAGFDMADATPFNFQFRGANPQLIDTGSLRLRQQHGIWEGYRQFCEQFLAPLLLQSWKQVDFQPWLRGRMSGIPLRQLSGLLSWRICCFGGGRSRTSGCTAGWPQRCSGGAAMKPRRPSVRR